MYNNVGGERNVGPGHLGEGDGNSGAWGGGGDDCVWAALRCAARTPGFGAL